MLYHAGPSSQREGQKQQQQQQQQQQNKAKQNNRSKAKKKTFPLAADVFCTFFAVVFDYNNVKLPILVTRFIEEMSHE